jgi:hypothetical protein
MTNRPENVRSFIEIAERLFQAPALPEVNRRLAARVFERLRAPSDDGVRHAARFPACEWIGAALADVIAQQTDLGAAARAIRAIEPALGWNRRTTGANGSANYVEGHAHGMVCGPGGAESRYDVQLGFSIMAPHIRYPDHSHPPEEAYVLFTRGEFRQRDGDWFDPGIGGGLHNTPNSLHAMKSGNTPLLAMWCLLV